MQIKNAKQNKFITLQQKSYELYFEIAVSRQYNMLVKCYDQK